MIIPVLLPLPFNHPFHYEGEEGYSSGDFVRVPFGKRELFGVVVADSKEHRLPDKTKIRPILEKCPYPPLAAVNLEFLEWVAKYTLQPPGSVLKMMMPAIGALETEKKVSGYLLNEAFQEKLSAGALKIQEVLKTRDAPLPLSEIASLAGVGEQTVRTFLKKGGLLSVPLPSSDHETLFDEAPSIPRLLEEQKEAAETLRLKLDQGYSTTLLDGVTGSGKTEVYLEAVSACLEGGKQALVLLPEISLSPQMVDRYRKRFGTDPVLWHSDLTPAQRRKAYRAVLRGEGRVIVGARSALFLPYPNLGLIVVDEEHDGAYKQEEGVIYHARDMAVVRARKGGIPIVLVSATPSLETIFNCEQGRYERLHLSSRYGDARLPEIELIDLKVEKKRGDKGWLSPPLCKAILGTLEAREQVLLYLNRRGYAPLTLCGSCGEKVECPFCTAWLVDHRKAGRLLCHHCGHTVTLSDTCAKCNAEGALVPCGPGVERIAEEVCRKFPSARVEILSSDMMTSPKKMQEILERVQSKEIDILIGTQMIAKGHHFPELTLVGVIDADIGLQGGDLRATEKTYQLLHQVSGRAGRSQKPGKVLIQTYMPQHPVMQALLSGDRDAFIARELASRSRGGLPPYGRLAGLILSSPHLKEVEGLARHLARIRPPSDLYQLLGPAPAPIALLRGRHRFRLLLKSGRNALPQPYLDDWLAKHPIPKNIKIQIDIDPQSFL